MSKDLNYYKKNCESEIPQTPISVLRYISELEKRVTEPVSEDKDLHKDLRKGVSLAERKQAQEVFRLLQQNASLQSRVRELEEHRYTINDIQKCVEHWGLCKVDSEYIQEFLNQDR